MTNPAPTPAEPRTVAEAWTAGANKVLVELMTRDLGGFLSGPKKNGQPEEWIAVGDIFAVVKDVAEHPPALASQPAADTLDAEALERAIYNAGLQPVEAGKYNVAPAVSSILRVAAAYRDAKGTPDEEER